MIKAGKSWLNRRGFFRDTKLQARLGVRARQHKLMVRAEEAAQTNVRYASGTGMTWAPG